ncbi:unnamed protein product [Caenorhabditis auriculariae]|uniref:Sarcoglycan complex subunit protein n=1 Tax=Caenorhabditis auriculariae TaxID=2777116 RepID=A0A8S1HUX8_9PELO|nr:unnamed protein product [Caenorhabditis auriculariae]
MRSYPVYGVATDEAVWSLNEEAIPRAVSHHSVTTPVMYATPASRNVTQHPANMRSSYAAYPSHTTVVQSTTKSMPDADIYRVGIYGWRKRLLYIFILVLTIVIIFNVALTVWIVTVLDFSTEGIGALKIEQEGIRVQGRAQFDRPVHFSELSTLRDETMTIDSFKGINLQARNSTGSISSRLSLLPEGKAQIICDRFEVFDEDSKLLFFADSDELGLKLENLRILDDGGSVFEGAIQTAIIRPQPDTPLRLESPTRSVSVDAAQDIELLAAAGEVNVNSLLDVAISSKTGEIRLESASIFMEKLHRADGRGTPQMQLCVCHNGKLFLAAPGADCRADRDICS